MCECNRAGAGLGENLNATIAQAIKLGGEGVLIDDDFANRGFGRNLSAGKAVNVDLAAIGAGGRTGESLEFAGQFVRIVGKRVKILALDDHGVGIGCGVVSMVVESPLTWTCCCSAAMVNAIFNVLVVPGAITTPLDSNGVKP